MLLFYMVRKENQNMKIKRLLAAVLSLAMGVSMMTACGSSDNSSKAEKDSSATENTQKHTNDPMTVTTAKDLVAQMKVGWSLGNTMDSTGGSGVDAETSWGNVETTKLMIDQVKDAGFNVFRLPVSWGTHMDENYTVDEAWMNRVQEIVDYGIDNGMFVILNTHHEEWYMPKKDRADKDVEQLKALWKQICDRFQGYDEHLIFEGVNEPRLRGEGNEWIGDAESREVVNQYAKAFVETVRASGGNNPNRCIMVTPYAASSTKQNMEALEVPQGDDKIIVSIHAYLPYSFALDTAGTDQYTSIDSSITTLFTDINEVFLSKGIHVIIGEFGSVNKVNTEARVQCVKDYLSTAKQYGVPCCWWDNGTRIGNGENFGLLNRSEGGWYFPEIVDAIMETVNS